MISTVFYFLSWYYVLYKAVRANIFGYFAWICKDLLYLCSKRENIQSNQWCNENNLIDPCFEDWKQHQPIGGIFVMTAAQDTSMIGSAWAFELRCGQQGRALQKGASSCLRLRLGGDSWRGWQSEGTAVGGDREAVLNQLIHCSSTLFQKVMTRRMRCLLVTGVSGKSSRAWNCAHKFDQGDIAWWSQVSLWFQNSWIEVLAASLTSSVSLFGMKSASAAFLRNHPAKASWHWFANVLCSTCWADLSTLHDFTACLDIGAAWLWLAYRCRLRCNALSRNLQIADICFCRVCLSWSFPMS